MKKIILTSFLMCIFLCSNTYSYQTIISNNTLDEYNYITYEMTGNRLGDISSNKHSSVFSRLNNNSSKHNMLSIEIDLRRVEAESMQPVHFVILKFIGNREDIRKLTNYSSPYKLYLKIDSQYVYLETSDNYKFVENITNDMYKLMLLYDIDDSILQRIVFAQALKVQVIDTRPKLFGLSKVYYEKMFSKENHENFLDFYQKHIIKTVGDQSK